MFSTVYLIVEIFLKASSPVKLNSDMRAIVIGARQRFCEIIVADRYSSSRKTAAPMRLADDSLPFVLR